MHPAVAIVAADHVRRLVVPALVADGAVLLLGVQVRAIVAHGVAERPPLEDALDVVGPVRHHGARRVAVHGSEPRPRLFGRAQGLAAPLALVVAGGKGLDAAAAAHHARRAHPASVGTLRLLILPPLQLLRGR